MKVNFLVISVELDRFIRPAISYIKADEREAIIHMITTSEKLPSAEHFTREITEDAEVKALWRIIILTKFFNKIAME